MRLSQVPLLITVLATASQTFALDGLTSPLETSPILRYFNEKQEAAKEEKAAKDEAAISSAAPNTAELAAKKERSFITGNPKTDAAYQKLLESAFPLSPDQMIFLRSLQEKSQQAAVTSPNPPPTPLSSTQIISLEPGTTPPVIRLAAGFVSSLIFVDITGNPWPLTAYGLGDPGAFNIQWDNNSNALFIQGLKNYAYGNLAVRLKDLNTPVMISLISGQKQMDYRVDLQIAARGPNAVAPILGESYTDPEINTSLINLLDGIPPHGSSRLDLAPVYGQAWLYNKQIYLRTQLQVLSPAWKATVSAPDGTRVYQLPKTPNILASQDGKTISIQLKGL
jgi:intracellular multiplication protein IcmK